MESTGIQRLFYFTWSVIKLNIFFILLSLAGGIILGVGPAWQVLSDLVQEHGIDYEKMTFKKAWSLWKETFKTSNMHFWLFTAISAFLGYNLYLSAQLMGGFWLFVDFLLMFVLLIISVLYFYVVLYTSNYDISLIDVVKLSFISIFLNFWVFVKVLFGVVSLLLLTWHFKGLVLFATFSLLMMWGNLVTRKNRQFVNGKLENDETDLQKAF